MNDVPSALLEILADGEEVLWWGMPDRRPHPTWRDFLEMPVAALCAYVSYTALRAMWATPVIIIGFLWPLIFALVPLFVFVVFPIQYVRLKRRTYFAVTNRRVVRLYAGRKTVLGDSRTLVSHPATTTHSQLSAEELREGGIGEGTVRLSVGIEEVGDIIADLSQALDASQK